MSAPKTIDIHAHILTEEAIRLMQKEAPKVGPKLTPIDGDFSVIDVAGALYKPFPRGAWDLEKRFADMDASGVDMQVVAACPQTYVYDQDASLALTFSQIQNDQMAALSREHPDRLLGLATLPMQAPQMAADELRRAMTEGGLAGMMIGSNVMGKNLDDPALEPLWATAEELGAFIMIHPVTVAAGDRIKDYYLKNLIGNPLDTTIAAACLVFGGVLERHPNLKICLSHGGGFTPYQAARWVHGWSVREEPKKHLKGSPQASLDKLLYDTILHATETLQSLIGWVGPSRVMLGSDYPFDMGQYDTVQLLDTLDLSSADRATILGNAARDLIVNFAEGQAKAAKRA